MFVAALKNFFKAYAVDHHENVIQKYFYTQFNVKKMIILRRKKDKASCIQSNVIFYLKKQAKALIANFCEEICCVHCK